VIYRSADRIIYDDLIDNACRKWKRAQSISELMLNVGKYFLEFPYMSNTLEMESEETLVINLRGFDCFTFIENVVVLARLIRDEIFTFEDYAAELEKIRYRNGIVNGYSSRLHYFSDWLFDNERKGIVKDITREKGGEPFLKEINFMTMHRDDYPGLSTDGSFRDMITVEKNLSGRSLYSIKKAELRRFENGIQNGDLIAITTGIEGLDVAHVGLAVRIQGRIHFLHASKIEKMVVLSAITLYQYLSKRKTMTGIMVGRVMPVCQNGDSL
jgi:hypothetical protein